MSCVAGTDDDYNYFSNYDYYDLFRLSKIAKIVSLCVRDNYILYFANHLLLITILSSLLPSVHFYAKVFKLHPNHAGKGKLTFLLRNIYG